MFQCQPSYHFDLVTPRCDQYLKFPNCDLDSLWPPSPSFSPSVGATCTSFIFLARFQAFHTLKKNVWLALQCQVVFFYCLCIFCAHYQTLQSVSICLFWVDYCYLAFPMLMDDKGMLFHLLLPFLYIFYIYTIIVRGANNFDTYGFQNKLDDLIKNIETWV